MLIFLTVDIPSFLCEKNDKSILCIFDTFTFAKAKKYEISPLRFTSVEMTYKEKTSIKS